jgi:SAM-dependent methyltransferase
MRLLDEEKIFYAKFPERFASLHNDPALVRVYEQFGIDVFRRSAVLEGFDVFLRAKNFTGRRCVEIGTCNGLTAVVLSRYFDEVVSIDIVPNSKKHEIAKFLGIENIRFIDVRHNAEKADVIRGLEFDAAFTDGDHARDTDSDFALVERCGNVLMHEHWDAQPAVVSLAKNLRERGTVFADGKWALWRRGG